MILESKQIKAKTLFNSLQNSNIIGNNITCYGTIKMLKKLSRLRTAITRLF